MTFVGPIPQPPGPTSRAKLDWDALVRWQKSVELAVYAVQNNRAEANLLLHKLADTPLMAGVQDGQAPTFDLGLGQFWPKPVLAEAVFQLQAALTATTSPPWHCRFGATLVAVAADLGVFSTGPIEFDLLVNGSSVQSFSFDAQSSGRMTVDPPQPEIVAYTDLVAIEMTSVGSGNSDLVVHVELGVTSGLTTV